MPLYVDNIEIPLHIESAGPAAIGDYLMKLKPAEVLPPIEVKVEAEPVVTPATDNAAQGNLGE